MAENYIPSKSIWGSKVTREHMLQKISLLAMLGPIREGEKEHNLITNPGQECSMTASGDCGLAVRCLEIVTAIRELRRS